MTIFAAETPSQLARLANAEGYEVVLELGPDGHKSASRWTYRHLIAYRLLASAPKPFLATLNDFHDADCPICNPEALCSQELDQEETAHLIYGPRSLELLRNTHSYLMRLSAGSFWVALARACSPDVLEAERVHPGRERQPVSRQDFIDSTQMQVGSSSPIQFSSSPKSPSSEEADVSMAALDVDENEARRRMPEELTVTLVRAFLEQVLHICLKQKPHRPREFRVRVERKTTKIIVGDREITAEDDGGICRAEPADGYAWKVVDDFVAILEAKKAFQRVEDGLRGGDVVPVLSNETLAQYLAEATITWKANRATLQQGVFLIAATSTFARFMHFRFGPRYGDYLDATSVRAQKGLANQDTKEDTYVRMESSEWHNLQSSEGRKSAMCHVLSLLRWYELESPAREVELDLDSQDSDEFAEEMVEDTD